MPINGTPGDDDLIGTNGDDTFDLTQGGNDVAKGKAGADTFLLGATLAKGDRIIGGADTDTLALDGNYAGGFTFRANTIVDIERILVAAGNSYELVTNDANVAAAATLTFDASALGAAHALIVNGAAELDGILSFIGGAGNDDLTGGAGADFFDLRLGGVDNVNGGAGNNQFVLGDTLTPADRIDGGVAGANNNLSLLGDYNIVFQANTIRNIANITLLGGHDYDITLNDGNTAVGQVMSVNSYNLSAADTTIVDGSAETDGRLFMNAGASNDTLIGGGLADRFTMPFGGDDFIRGNDGDDAVLFTGGMLTPADRINGGNGTDTLELSGDFSSGISFQNNTFTNMERIFLYDGFSYSLTPANGNVAAGQTLTVDAAFLTGANILEWQGSQEVDGRYVVFGGAGNDIIRGGAEDDQFTGGLGADILEGRGGSDIFRYAAIAESTGPGYDTIEKFRHGTDLFDLTNLINDVDAPVTAGRLRADHFDADLTAALDGEPSPAEGLLRANHAILFTPSTGDLAGRTFLVADANNTDGYQTGEDFVFDITGYIGAPTVADFI